LVWDIECGSLVDSLAVGIDHSLDILYSLIVRIESKLRELKRLIIRLQGLPFAPRKPVVVAANWMKERGKNQMIQEDLRAMKINLSMY
jgi:hypothetical protein